MAERNETEWILIYNHVYEVLDRYVGLIGKPGCNPCLVIALMHNLLIKYELGIRNEELFQEMRGME